MFELNQVCRVIIRYPNIQLKYYYMGENITRFILSR